MMCIEYHWQMLNWNEIILINLSVDGRKEQKDDNVKRNILLLWSEMLSVGCYFLPIFSLLMYIRRFKQFLMAFAFSYSYFRTNQTHTHNLAIFSLESVQKVLSG